MDSGKWIRVSLVLMLALDAGYSGLCTGSGPEVERLPGAGECDRLPQVHHGDGAARRREYPRTEIEVGVVCPKGAECEQDQDVKIRFHWVCPGDQKFENKYICKEVDFDAEVTVNGKLVFDPNGGRYPPPPCARGYLIGWVIDVDNFQPIKFDGLIGDAIIRETAQDAAAYNAVPIQAYCGDPHGAPRTLGPDGSLVFDGTAWYYQAITGREYCDVRFDIRRALSRRRRV